MPKTSAPTITSTPDRFTLCLPFTLDQEQNVPGDWSNPKNFDNDPHDPGGATMDGITQGEYDVWRKTLGLPTQAVEKIAEAEGYAIYRTSYWLPYCPHLPVGLDLQFFDAAVNQGIGEAIRILQVALGIPNDGLWEPAAAAAVAKISDVKAVIEAFTTRRLAVYRESANYEYFGTDWDRRADEIGAEALKMEVA
jgi:lysozyme family protein